MCSRPPQFSCQSVEVFDSQEKPVSGGCVQSFPPMVLTGKSLVVSITRLLRTFFSLTFLYGYAAPSIRGHCVIPTKPLCSRTLRMGFVDSLNSNDPASSHVYPPLFFPNIFPFVPEFHRQVLDSFFRSLFFPPTPRFCAGRMARSLGPSFHVLQAGEGRLG